MKGAPCCKGQQHGQHPTNLIRVEPGTWHRGQGRLQALSDGIQNVDFDRKLGPIMRSQEVEGDTDSQIRWLSIPLPPGCASEH